MPSRTTGAATPPVQITAERKAIRGSLLWNASTPGNLKVAVAKLRRRKNSRGADDVTVETFLAHLPAEIRSLHARLRSGTYRFRPLRPKAIPKSDGGWRPILIPAVSDRVAQRAIYEVIEPFLRRFVDQPNSYAFRVGRGVRDAVFRLREQMQGGRNVVLIADIEKFFDSIDTEILFSKIDALLPDPSLRPLLKQLHDWEIHDLGSLPDAQRKCFPTAGTGIPQGSILSPILANLYLSEIDAGARARGIELIRYADDIAVCARTEDEALQALEWLRGRLASISLTVHALGVHKKTKMILDARSSGVEYLGFYLRDKKGALHIKTADRAVKSAKALVAEIFDPRRRMSLANRYTSLSHFLSGWFMSYSYVCDITREAAELLDHVQACVATLLRDYELLAPGQSVSTRQRRLLGVDDLFANLQRRVEHARRRQRSPSRSPTPA